MRTGQCQCGEIRYKSTGEVIGLYICHCHECQKQSASAFGITLDVTRSGFQLILGLPKFWVRNTDSGKKLKCAFCPNCGTRLWHEEEPATEIISIKGGSLDEPLDISSAVHVWVSRKLSGVVIPERCQQLLKE